jgi:hypothetical protein
MSRISKTPCKNDFSTIGSQYGNNFTQSFMRPDASSRIQAFRFTSNQKERVVTALLDNANRDSSPTQIHTGKTPETIMNLRVRDRSKELAKDMTYKANTYAQKISEAI